MNNLFSLLRKNKRESPIFFSAIIDYNDNLKAREFDLGNQEFLYFENYKSEFSIKELEYLLQKYIETDLKYEIHEMSGFEVTITVSNIKRGSIIIFFSMAAATYYGISKYKNFIESMPLLRNHIEWLLNRFINLRFGKILTAKVSLNNAISIQNDKSIHLGYLPLLSVIVGALIAGYFTIATQKIANSQQLKTLDKQQLIAERQELKNALTEYSEVLSNYTDIITDNKLESSKVIDFEKNAFRIAMKISLLVNSSLVEKTFKLNELAAVHLQKKLKGTYTMNDSNYFTEQSIKWVKAAKLELKNN